MTTNRSRPLGYTQERHRKQAMERLNEAKKELMMIKAELRLMATKKMTQEAVAERATALMVRAMAAEVAVVQAENELLRMRGADE